ncbi:DUF4954 family protein [candidate division KSB1 bacterium]|nr:DUF4954 family protein [candidate division KSB1 bacterium]
MYNVNLLPGSNLGKNFIPEQYLPKNKDEHYLRNEQNPRPEGYWRHLRDDEVERLRKNNNSAENWSEILVTEKFDPDRIFHANFFGLVRIGSVQNSILQHHDLQLPVGITNSKVISCDIGDNVAIHNVSYLAHYIIGDRCILFNIDEMHTTNYAKFGNGIIKQGEPETVRVWLDLMNEAGGRRVLPFDGMLPADAWIWSKYRDDTALQEKLIEITQKQFDDRRGYYGFIGEQCVLKNSRILKDVNMGPFCYIKGANKLKNLTIHSSPQEPTQIGEGVELVNGIIGYGCSVFYGCKAVRFILGENSSLKYGARLIHSFLGDNSTISCCEVLNNLIFPAHEQHHNNSFLIAAVVKGQSNIAAGATIGSNHNSRAHDNEISAGRGFWPGLCTSLKHSSRFASFVLLAKADYPAELDIPFPFALLNNNTAKDRLEVLPAYWWMYNMYALARNTWKFNNRDKRINKAQHIEFDFLAPDTVEEIFHARRLLELWTAQAGGAQTESLDQMAQTGRRMLNTENAIPEIYGQNMEKSARKVVILKAQKAYHAYGDMLFYYAVKNIADFLRINRIKNLDEFIQVFKSGRERHWENIGGQIVRQNDVDKLRSDIGSGKVNTWQEIHKKYDDFWKKYPLDKQQHAYATLCDLFEVEYITKQQWIQALKKAAKIQQFICDQVYSTRKKDEDNPFRQVTFRNRDEMTATLGSVEDNDFIKQIRETSADFIRNVEELLEIQYRHSV